MHGADVDDFAPAFGLHAVFHKSLSHKKGTLQIYVEYEIVVLFTDVPEVRAPLEARIVHQNIDAAKLLDRTRDEFLPLADLAHIALKRSGFSAAFLYDRDNFVSAGLIRAIAQRHIRAFRRQPLHNRAPYALIPASHGNYFAFQSVCHVALLNVSAHR